MAFCQNCGFQLTDGTAFCSNCGAKQGVVAAKPQERMITIKRTGAFGTDPMGVYIDDGEYAILRLGESKTFPIPAGMHRLQVRTTSHAVGKGGLTVGRKNSYSSDVVYIRESDGDLTFNVTMSMFGKITLSAV